MSARSHPPPIPIRVFWMLAFTAVVGYVAARLGVSSLWADVAAPPGTLRLPNTFASVDHPFHVARADVLWRELASGRVLRWVGQHQGGYPVEFYPLGAAWLEIIVRAGSLGLLSAQGAHTLTIACLFLLPGLAYAALARIDDLPVAVAFLALILHVSLPGSWYHGGYTELVQWGLVTNVASAVAAFLALPAMISFLRGGNGVAGAVAAALCAWAVYCNPRSIVGLAAIAIGAWLAVVLFPASGHALHDDSGGSNASRGARLASGRIALVALIAILLAAPLLAALLRFGGLYTFVHYSGYVTITKYLAATRDAASWPIVALAIGGVGLGFASRRLAATRAAAVSLLLFAVLTMAAAFSPLVASVAPQLEPTRLMPFQRFLVIHLASLAAWTAISWLSSRLRLPRVWAAPALAFVIALVVLVMQTRTLPGPMLDPASDAVPPVSLYPVPMSAVPEQFDFEMGMRAADDAAAPGTALLILGSALSWHQQLWAPLWTDRPLFYDNWLWYWHPSHAGTPRYSFAAGHHYPDPASTLETGYLDRHGVGGVVVTGAAREAAARSPLLERVRSGVYDVYTVRDPTSIVTFGGANAALLDVRHQSIVAVTDAPAAPIVARANWHPRWVATADSESAAIQRLATGYIGVESDRLARRLDISYAVQPFDWVARAMAMLGIVGIGAMALGHRGSGSPMRRWYARRSSPATSAEGDVPTS